MFKDKMELRLRMAVLPFIETRFSRKDHISEIGRCETTHTYKKYIQEVLLDDLLPVLHHQHRVSNLAEIELLAERMFPYQEIRRVTLKGTKPGLFLLERLRQLSRIFLTHRNGKVSLKYWGPPEDANSRDSLFNAYKDIHKVALWNSLNRIFCVEPMVMSYLIDNQMDDPIYLNGYHSFVHLPDIQLDQVLDQGVAETHLHFSASGHFYMNWQRMMSPRREDLKGLIADQRSFDKMLSRDEQLNCLQMAAASVRLLLAYYLVLAAGERSFGLWMVDTFGVEVEDNGDSDTLSFAIKAFAGEKAFGNPLETIPQLFRIHEMVKSRLNIALQGKTNNSTGLESLNSGDIIGQVFQEDIPSTPAENLLLFKALHYLKSGREDVLFSSLFWQYIRVKNQIFDCMVQRNVMKGLPYFKRFFDQATSINISESQSETWTYLLKHQLSNSQLRKIEVRITPGNGNSIQSSMTQLARKLLNFFSAYRSVLIYYQHNRKGDAPLAGVILHFIKKPDPTDVEKCWMNYNEKVGNGESLHFKKIQDSYLTEMKAILKLREEIVGLADYLVGIDAANLESFTEPWVFAPVFRQARNSDTYKLVYKERPLKPIQNLGFTYHVGEDFRHLITGLRQIDEVIEHFQFHAGDRIGHGMVLGVSPATWAERNKIVIMPRGEYLENLLWIWGLWKNGIQLPGFDSSHLEQKILRVANEIYAPQQGEGMCSAPGLNVFMLWRAYRRKFREEIGSPLPTQAEELGSWDCEQRNGIINWDEQMLANAAHCKCFLLSMRYPIELEVTKEEIKWIEHLQRLVVEKVSQSGIVVETNPTSNTAIGEIEHIFEHYIHQLNGRSLYDHSHKEAGAMVTINTDDPIVFNTNISNEYAYIFYSLQEKGVPRDSILQWINRVRENGMNSSFIHSRSLTYSNAISETDAIIEQLKDYL